MVPEELTPFRHNWLNRTFLNLKILVESQHTSDIDSEYVLPWCVCVYFSIFEFKYLWSRNVLTLLLYSGAIKFSNFIMQISIKIIELCRNCLFELLAML